MNKVLLIGRLSRDPEMRSLASGQSITTFTLVTEEFLANGEQTQYHAIVTTDRLAEICGTYLARGQQVAIEGRLESRTWEDDRNQRHWKTEVIASVVRMLDGVRKADFNANLAADAAARRDLLPSQR